jgi:hypothetical protein
MEIFTLTYFKRVKKLFFEKNIHSYLNISTMLYVLYIDTWLVKFNLKLTFLKKSSLINLINYQRDCDICEIWYWSISYDECRFIYLFIEDFIIFNRKWWKMALFLELTFQMEEQNSSVSALNNSTFKINVRDNIFMDFESVKS